MSKDYLPLMGMNRGVYTLPGLGARKRAYIAAGAGVDFLASAMMETDMMDPSSYPVGDQVNGIAKIEDAFNAGACKQNWGMMRGAYEPWKSLGPRITKPPSC